MAKQILIVDDEEAVLVLLSATLANDDRYSLLLARNGEEAIRICGRQSPDLLFLDITMPGMDGYEVCRSLRNNPSNGDIKIVMLTAMAQDLDRRKANEVGADDYMTKPFSPTALMEKVEELLGV